MYISHSVLVTILQLSHALVDCDEADSLSLTDPLTYTHLVVVVITWHSLCLSLLWGGGEVK